MPGLRQGKCEGLRLYLRSAACTMLVLVACAALTHTAAIRAEPEAAGKPASTREKPPRAADTAFSRGLLRRPATQPIFAPPGENAEHKNPEDTLSVIGIRG